MPPDSALDIAAAWLQKAQSDLRAVDILRGDPHPPLDMLCFHCQQVAEKSLKALLSHLSIPFPKTHDLAYLLTLLGARAPLAPADPAVAELSHLAVAPRYPFEPEDVTADVADRAEATARRIRAAVLAALS